MRAKFLVAVGLLASSLAMAGNDPKTGVPAADAKPVAAGATTTAATDQKAVISAIEKKYSGVTAMQAAFVQTSHSQTFGDDKQSGTVALKRPKQMFWDFGNKQFVTDGKTMWVYTADDNQVIKYDNIGTSGGTTADELLTSLDKIDSLFAVTTLEDSVGHSFDLAPKKDNGSVKKVHLELSDDLLVEKVVITDSFDNITQLDFTDVKLNVEVPDSKFQFQVPPGAEVVSTGGK